MALQPIKCKNMDIKEKIWQCAEFDEIYVNIPTPYEILVEYEVKLKKDCHFMRSRIT